MSSMLVPSCCISRSRLLVRCSNSSSSNSTNTQTRLSDGWSKFSKRASGEWSGCAVDFDKHGKPTPLPAAVVPEEYKEWNVEVFDWETYSATEAGNKPRSFYNKTMRLYPTAGCGATTVTIYSTEEQKFCTDDDGNSRDKSKFLAFHHGGSYLAISRGTFGKVIPVFEVEHCLADEDIRTRILQRLETTTLSLLEITVFKEQWEEPFRSGKSVESCLTSHNGFSRLPPPADAFLQGTWRIVRSGLSMVEDESSGLFCRLKLMDQSEGGLVEERRSLDGFTLLPSGFWSKITRAGGDLVDVEAGWLKDYGLETPPRAIASRCRLSTSGRVEIVELETQYRESTMDMSDRNKSFYYVNWKILCYTSFLFSTYLLCQGAISGDRRK